MDKYLLVVMGFLMSWNTNCVYHTNNGRTSGRALYSTVLCFYWRHNSNYCL